MGPMRSRRYGRVPDQNRLVQDLLEHADALVGRGVKHPDAVQRRALQRRPRGTPPDAAWLRQYEHRDAAAARVDVLETNDPREYLARTVRAH